MSEVKIVCYVHLGTIRFPFSLKVFKVVDRWPRVCVYILSDVTPWVRDPSAQPSEGLQ